MTSNALIDAQFDRAVEIVQSLPKTGPIQTDYEEKLTMYSLYKQATVGNVKSPRPGIWDMLGRAKWDAWAKHRDLDQYEAKWLYVEALLKVLRKYSDKTVAMDYVEELESFGGDPSNIVMSRTLAKSPASDSSSSTTSDEPPHYTRPTALSSRNLQNYQGEEVDSTSEEETEDEAGELPAVHHSQTLQSNRPPSSMSSHRYRTPMAGSLAMSPPPIQGIPASQPLPGFETPSAFADPPPSSSYHPTNSYAGHFLESSRGEMATPSHSHPSHPQYRSQMQSQPSHYGPARPVSRPTLERAVENVQAHLAALSERLESLEAHSHLLRSHTSLSPRVVGTPAWVSGRGSPNDGNGHPHWDIDDLGMWSIVLNPISCGLDSLRHAATFFARNENRSPTMVIVRRLCLDVSFLVCVIAVIGALWRKSGVRRREVRAALIVLWRAVLGSKPARQMADRGV
ncbi:acyl CoA binding protein-domain-containing protein [Crucibulum laeve]|uniref:Acyl CoA binding protein-domain-containing protein n=1 Tax=Crucibulum laeve TaxID=68775 RepID=A0A5C3MDG9_9AGAR|nr:acyl CoA binding protein-domain-containing protein [Crucibulum laeve]